jgi:tRNA (guanine-N7-)-methyltransferase
MLMVMARHAGQFEWLATGPADWQGYPGGWPETRYAAKARREGRTPHQFRYRRV